MRGIAVELLHMRRLRWWHGVLWRGLHTDVHGRGSSDVRGRVRRHRHRHLELRRLRDRVLAADARDRDLRRWRVRQHMPERSNELLQLLPQPQH